jgi:hypothetical protein
MKYNFWITADYPEVRSQDHTSRLVPFLRGGTGLVFRKDILDIIFQYAISDIRRLTVKYDKLIEHRPFINIDDEKDNDYMKSTGKRKHDPESFLKSGAFNANRAIKIKKWLTFCNQKQKENIKITLSSRDFYYDRFFSSGVYELSVKVLFSKEVNSKNLCDLIAEMLSLEVRIPKILNVNFTNRINSDFSGAEYLTSLGHAGRAIVRHYLLATSRGKYCSDDVINDSFKYLNVYDPRIFVKTYNGEKIDLPREYETKNNVLIKKYSVKDKFGTKYNNVFLLHNLKRRNGKAYNKIYNALNEVPVFERTLEFVFTSINNGNLIPEERSNASDELQWFVVSYIRMIKNRDFYSGFEDESFYIKFDRPGLEHILDDKIKVRPDTLRIVKEYIDEEKLLLAKKKAKKLLRISFVVVAIVLIVSAFIFPDFSRVVMILYALFLTITGLLPENILKLLLPILSK